MKVTERDDSICAACGVQAYAMIPVFQPNIGVRCFIGVRSMDALEQFEKEHGDSVKYICLNCAKHDLDRITRTIAAFNIATSRNN